MKEYVMLQDALNTAVMGDLRSNKEGIERAILAVDLLSKESKFITV